MEIVLGLAGHRDAGTVAGGGAGFGKHTYFVGGLFMQWAGSSA